MYVCEGTCVRLRVCTRCNIVCFPFPHGRGSTGMPAQGRPGLHGKLSGRLSDGRGLKEKHPALTHYCVSTSPKKTSDSVLYKVGELP